MRVNNEKILLGLFVISIFHRTLLLLFLVYLFWISFYSVADCIKSLFLISLRTILGTQIAVPISSFQMIKWLIIFVIATLVLIKTNHSIMRIERYIKLRKNLIVVGMFGGFVFCVSLFNSSYPIVSIFKIFSFVYVFISVLLGVCVTASKVHWGKFVYKYMSIIIWTSLAMALVPQGYYLTTHYLQGVTNQCNMLGILSALYVALVIYLIAIEGGTTDKKVSLAVGIICCWMSRSRTGMLSIVLTLLIWLFIVKLKKGLKAKIVAGIICVIVVMMIVPYTRSIIISNVSEFVFKRQEVSINSSLGDVLVSREKQKQNFITKLENNILFGSGFQTPYSSNRQDWSFSFDLIVEPGNIIYAVLGDLGVLGFLIFLCFVINLFIGVKCKSGYLVLAAPFTISLGEMVFFSVNNIAVILYIFIGMAIFGRKMIDD